MILKPCVRYLEESLEDEDELSLLILVDRDKLPPELCRLRFSTYLYQPPPPSSLSSPPILEAYEGNSLRIALKLSKFEPLNL